jgi:hypothetical protein
VLCDDVVKYGALYKICLDFNVVQAIEADISRGVDQLTKVYFMVFHCYETDQMRPRSHVCEEM